MKQVTQEDAHSLIFELQEAHYLAAINNKNSISNSVFQNTFKGSNDSMHSVAAALLSTGSTHGPITEARGLIKMFKADSERTRLLIEGRVEDGGKIPGLGNSFFKDQIDPSFHKVWNLYIGTYVENESSLAPISDISLLVSHAKFGTPDRRLYPNAAGITACIVEYLQLADYTENWFFISGRSRAWLESLTEK